jgi:hypothetical protein
MLSRYSDLQRDEIPLQSSKTQDILGVLQHVLQQRVAQRIVIESGRVLVYRPRGDEPLEDNDVSLDGALRNSELIEYENTEGNAFEMIFDIMQLVASEKLFPVCWATGKKQDEILQKWVALEERGMPPDALDTLVMIPVVRLQTLSEDTLILCASRHEDGEAKDIVVGIKTVMELRDEEEASSEADHPVGDDSEGHAQATRAVEALAPRVDGGGWHPTNLAGVRMGDGKGLRRNARKRN